MLPNVEVIDGKDREGNDKVEDDGEEDEENSRSVEPVEDEEEEPAEEEKREPVQVIEDDAEEDEEESEVDDKPAPQQIKSKPYNTELTPTYRPVLQNPSSFPSSYPPSFPPGGYDEYTPGAFAEPPSFLGDDEGFGLGKRGLNVREDLFGELLDENRDQSENEEGNRGLFD